MPVSANATAPLPLHRTVGALDPARLAAESEASVRAILSEGESANTRRSYASALRYWGAWFYLRYGRTLFMPVPAPAVVQFLVDHLEHTGEDETLKYDLPPAIDQALVAGHYKKKPGPIAIGTAMQRLAVLSKAHTMKELPNPVRDPAVDEFVRRLKRAYAGRGVKPISKTAITRDPLEKMLATCTDGLRGVRDRALLLFAWASGGRRRSEVAAARLENLTHVDENAYLYELTHSKTDQAGTAGKADTQKPVMGPAAQALTAWLAASGVRSGAIFRRIRGSKALGPLSPQAVGHIVQRRARLAGLKGNFGGHSLRSGFVTEAARQGVTLGDAMALTGHQSSQTALRYYQPGAVQLARAANLLGDPVREKEPAIRDAGPSQAPD